MTSPYEDDAEETDEKDPQELARFWSLQLELATNDLKPFIDDGRKVVAMYRKGQAEAKRARTMRSFNILYSNTEVLRSALYGKDPKPDVRRRFNDPNPTGRESAEAIERMLVYVQEQDDPGAEVEAAVQDYLLAGRGVIRVVYEPVIEEQPVMGPDGQPTLDGETGEPVTQSQIVEQKLSEEYVFWEDFVHPTARSWAKLPWIAFRHQFSRDELEEQIFEAAPQSSKTFGDAKDVPLNWSPDVGRDKTRVPEYLKKAEVFEVWQRCDKKRYWIVKGHKTVIRVDEDPYGLRDFWPMAEPIASYVTTDSMVPEPEFHAYKDQASDLDELTARISRLTRALKRRGVYDEAIPELKRLALAGDNDFIPVKNWGAFATKGGLAKAFESEDISIVAAVLEGLYKQRDMLIQGIYQLTGIADIMRGSTAPEETATAQTIKSQFGSMRLKRRQRALQKWIRETLRIKAEIISEHFEPQIIMQATQLQITPEIMAVLRSDKLRGYQVNIETDSTILEDAAMEQQSRIGLITAMSTFLRSAVPGIQMMPELTPLIIKMLDFGVRSFKPGREFEDMLEEFMKNSGQIVQQLQQQKQAEAQQNSPQAKAQIDGQVAQQKVAMEGQKVQAQVEGIHAKTAATVQAGQQKMAMQQMQHEDDRQRQEAQFGQQMQQEAQASHAQIQIGERKNDIAAHGQQITQQANAGNDALAHKVDALTHQVSQLTAMLSQALAPPQAGPPPSPPVQ